MQVAVKQASFQLALLIALTAIPPLAHAGMSSLEIVRAEARARASGDHQKVRMLVSPDAVVFSVPRNPDLLVGEQREPFFPGMLARRRQVGIVDAVAVDDLVAAQAWIHPRSPDTRPQILLSIYRLRDARVQNIWHLAIADAKGPERSEDPARDVIRRMVAASNERDVEAFLALFSPGAKIFRTSDDAQGLADQVSETMSHYRVRNGLITHDWTAYQQ